jgi:cell division protein FtsW
VSAGIRARLPVHRHYRHQRQVDDDGAHRPHPEVGRAGHADGGNIGTAILSLAEPTDDRFYVVECSSYQIDLAPTLDPTAGILLNLSPDHLDRHGSMEAYAAIKERLVARSATAIVGIDDSHCAAIAARLQDTGAALVRISKHESDEAMIAASGTRILLREPGRGSRTIAELDGIPTLRGSHNAQNAAAAIAACRAVGIDEADIQHGLRSFPGLKHRMQPVARRGKVVFVNDSKATNADAAAPALGSYEHIFWIAGGLAKEGGITSLTDLFPRIEKAYLIGEAAPAFAATLGQAVALRNFRHARAGGRFGRAGRDGKRIRCSRRHAQSGLRKLRPVQEFREARRCVRRACAGARRHRDAGRNGEGERLSMVSRAERGPVAEWFWTIDRVFLIAFICLIGLGFMLSFAASPPVAERIGLDSFHFVKRHAVFLLPTIAVMIGISFLSPRQVRRVALFLFMGSIFLMLVALFFGVEVKGSRRWVSLAGISIQPSEFMKPAFVIICAWLFSEHARQPEIPGNLFAIILFGMVAALLLAQPDLGQTILVAAIWGGMFFVAGMPWFWIILLGALGAAGFVSAYFVFPHVAGRIDRFLTGEGDTFQVDTARESDHPRRLVRQGPGEGTSSASFPTAIPTSSSRSRPRNSASSSAWCWCCIFAFIVLRGLFVVAASATTRSPAGVTGLVLLFGIQSLINISVNLELMPAKGMTLPLISYGGSSMIAIWRSAPASCWR